MRYGLPVQLS